MAAHSSVSPRAALNACVKTLWLHCGETFKKICKLLPLSFGPLRTIMGLLLTSIMQTTVYCLHEILSAMKLFISHKHEIVTNHKEFENKATLAATHILHSNIETKCAVLFRYATLNLEKMWRGKEILHSESPAMGISFSVDVSMGVM